MSAEYSTQVPAQNPKTSYLTSDALGSVRVITDQNGEVVSRRDFMPYGVELTAGIGPRNTAQKYSFGDGVRQKFTTYKRDDESGLDYAESRYYSPKWGRFTSPDEFKGGPDELFDFEEDASDNPTFYADLTNPQSLNKYQYTYNNPYKLTDPTGHCPPCLAPAVPYVAPVAGKLIIDVAVAIGAGAVIGAVVSAVNRLPEGGIEVDNTAAGRMARAREQQLLFNRDAREQQSQQANTQPQVQAQASGSVGGSAGGNGNNRGNNNRRSGNNRSQNRGGRGRFKRGQDASDQRESINFAQGKIRKGQGRGIIDSTKKSDDREREKLKPKNIPNLKEAQKEFDNR